MDSQVRQNYHRDCEAAINRMVNMELYASYVYMSMISLLPPQILPPDWHLEISPVPLPAPSRHITLTVMMWHYSMWPTSSWSSHMRSGSTPSTCCASRTSVEAASCSRTSRSQSEMLGAPHWRPWRLRCSWRRLSTRPCWTCTDWPPRRLTPISVTCWSPTTWTSK